ncbi:MULTISPECIES: hypothetical protein [unclassified Sphingomonas]|uniref:hypothetical protein n=1 Tax=unclassified Sphingomonas TaxID=196159 RepID=UPI00226B6E40|nr:MULTISPECIES: hypothetical protein [unclassified Sphingomonas]
MTSGIKYASLALLALAAGASTLDLIRGMRIEATRTVLASPSRVGRDQLLAGWEHRGGDTSGGLAGTAPPEALPLAALWIDQAAASPLALQQRALAHADALLASTRWVRPEAPGASLLAVRADLVRYGQPRPATLLTFARSYDQAGFLRDEGLWRLAFAAIYWRALPEKTRIAVVNEAVWLARIDGRLRTAVDQLVTGTPLALPVELRLLS